MATFTSQYFFYYVKPFVPRSLQVILRRLIANYKRKKYARIWPVDERTAAPPPDWKGWPEKKKFAFMLMHDVDTKKGQDNVHKLMDLEEKLGVRSIFYIVPERYIVSTQVLKEIRSRGFGLGVHGLNHDGKLFLSYDIFRIKASRINEYFKLWGTKAFSSPSMHHRLEWMHHLDMETCTSTFDTDPIEPQPDASGTIFPFMVKNDPDKQGFVELPYTLPQDFTLYIILQEDTIDIWKKKADWIADKGGMLLMNSHPDYMDFTNGKNPGHEEYPVQRYIDFVTYIKEKHSGQYWNALPNEVAEFVKSTREKKQ